MKAIDKIEEIQKSEYFAYGVHPSKIRNYIEQEEMKRLRQLAFVSPYYENYLGGYKFFSIKNKSTNDLLLSKYDGGLDLEAFIMAYRIIKEILVDKDVIQDVKIRTIATTINNNLNSNLFLDKDGYGSILMSRTSILVSTNIFMALCPVFFEKVNKNIITFENIYKRFHYKDIPKRGNVITSGFNKVREKMSYLPVFGRFSDSGPIKPDLSLMEISNEMYLGLVVFLISHELAHYSLNHINLLKNYTSTKKQISDAKSFYLKLKKIDGIGNLPNWSDTYAYTFYKTGLEAEADFLAIKLLHEFSFRLAGSPQRFFQNSLLGIAIHFTFNTATEKGLFYCKHEIDPDNLKLFSDHRPVFDFFFRKSHPSPITRLESISLNWSTESKIFGRNKTLDQNDINAEFQDAISLMHAIWTFAKKDLKDFLGNVNSSYNEFKWPYSKFHDYYSELDPYLEFITK